MSALLSISARKKLEERREKVRAHLDKLRAELIDLNSRLADEPDSLSTRVRELIAKRPGITTRELAEELGVPKISELILGQLVKRGRLRRVGGRGRGAVSRYYLGADKSSAIAAEQAKGGGG